MKFILRKQNRLGILKSTYDYLCSLDADKEYDVTITELKKTRSIEQNKLQRKWLGELESQGDMTAEQYRAHTKLHIGVAILKSESEEFAEKYDRTIRPMPYETKLELMMLPFDFPVTRLMSVKQKQKYLDSMFQYWASKGFILTQPGE